MSKTYIPVAVRKQVEERANGCCEYCLSPNIATFLPHEIDHTLPKNMVD
jgi:5-methylcytosine-specific restriction endonuclease McrA